MVVEEDRAFARYFGKLGILLEIVGDVAVVRSVIGCGIPEHTRKRVRNSTLPGTVGVQKVIDDDVEV